jgi:hypothetical protein
MMIDVEMKDSVVTTATIDALEAEIRSVLSPADLITPDAVRGTDPASVTRFGRGAGRRSAPCAGRIIFMLDNESDAAIELAGHPSLRGRILFAPSSPGDDDCRGGQAQRPDRRRGRDQGCARRQHAGAHPRRRRHRAGAHRQHRDAAGPP